MDGAADGRPPGVEFHTFTVIGRCRRTGRLGVGTATRSLAVGARVPHVRAGLGAVAIMAIADARLGQMARGSSWRGSGLPKPRGIVRERDERKLMAGSSSYCLRATHRGGKETGHARQGRGDDRRYLGNR
jgi:hypothetical protein